MTVSKQCWQKNNFGTNKLYLNFIKPKGKIVKRNYLSWWISDMLERTGKQIQ